MANKHESRAEQIIQVAGIIPECVVNAPGGISYVIFAQGCGHRCPGCHNPETHDFSAGEAWTVEAVLQDVKRYPLSQIVTFSGGDPFFQAEPFTYLAKALKRANYTIVAYTGFYIEDILSERQGDPSKRALLTSIDVLIDGPFIQSLKERALNFRGSTNQRIIDVQRSLRSGELVILDQYYEEDHYKSKYRSDIHEKR